MKQKLTFEAIMDTVEKEQLGIMVRNCAPSSVEEAKVAKKNHPNVIMKIAETSDAGTCIGILPKD